MYTGGHDQGRYNRKDSLYRAAKLMLIPTIAWLCAASLLLFDYLRFQLSSAATLMLVAICGTVGAWLPFHSIKSRKWRHYEHSFDSYTTWQRRGGDIVVLSIFAATPFLYFAL
ncbi:hypothetical protein ASU33_18680 [Solirubrum puertoriconensis]|uniref:Uncharacterized protein n=1 Tax=Solirubrum puertoriconensis TaxID=1751427 RepID=A0A9X0L6F0_SOLP1|nr:hypothetical protein ASU33_18680 [Solirubrum puertoriconensis]